MFCPRCGKELKNNQRFCINCGYDLSEELSAVKNNQDDFYKKKSYYKQPKYYAHWLPSVDNSTYA